MLKYRGSLDGIRHYKIKGKEGSFAVYVTPVSADRIKKGAEFARTRENMNEFGACGRITASFRMGIAPLLTQMADDTMSARAVKLMKKINLEDLSEARGYRAILVSKKGEMLIRFPYRESLQLRDVLRAPYSMTHTESKESATFHIEPFVPAKVLTYPSGATHFRFIQILSVLSDFAYNAVTEQYEPVEAVLNEKSVITYSDYFPVSDDVAQVLSLTSTLTNVEGLATAQVACIQSVGIEFVQQVGERYVSFTKDALMVGDVF
ncbi:hypothetical protein [Parabacteroides sp. FAFU027]|uniref:hypothetical protein n=1 Tax=Parabacteroides sp. FAFU027 TaxID=2922715 RepID=UPI001FB02BAF|nr:hypothetical protein [Parabacteroides sp. FAFU027]